MISEEEVMGIWQALPDIYCTTDTMQGYVLMKPHGYSGDFVVIERIYSGWLSPKQHLINWDRFFIVRKLHAPLSTEKNILSTCCVLAILRMQNGRF